MKLSSVAARVVDKKVAVQVMKGLIRISKMEKENADMRERSLALVKAIPKMSPDKAEVARRTLEDMRRQVIANNKEIADLRVLCLEDQTVSTDDIMAAFRYARWQPVKTLQTDPEGIFSTEVPSGEWYLVAWANRRVLDQEEKYLWIVEAKAGERNLLNNSNLYSH